MYGLLRVLFLMRWYGLLWVSNQTDRSCPGSSHTSWGFQNYMQFHLIQQKDNVFKLSPWNWSNSDSDGLLTSWMVPGPYQLMGRLQWSAWCHLNQCLHGNLFPPDPQRQCWRLCFEQRLAAGPYSSGFLGYHVCSKQHFPVVHFSNE